jgi:Cas6b C-terminal domain/Cas6b N-terminal domain
MSIALEMLVAPKALTPKGNAQSLRTLAIHFPTIELFPRQIPAWRNAVIESLEQCNGLDAAASSHFHNHVEDSAATLHRPALVQYRCKGGKAMLWGMNEGATLLGQWLAEAPQQFRLHGQTVPLNPVQLERTSTPLRLTTDWQYYRLHDYLALNVDNYRRWLDEPKLSTRIQLMEQALTGHLLGFCKAAGYWLPEGQRLEVDLVEQHGYRKVRYHDVNLLAFELTYRVNLCLPDEVALGKAVSHGFGVQRKAPKY